MPDPAQTSILQLLIPGTFGLLAGLGGVTLQSVLQTRGKNDDRRHEKKHILRGKAEEILTEANLSVDRARDALFQAIEDVHNVPRKEALLSLTPTDRLKALLGLYFPEAKPFVDAYTERTIEIFRAQGEANKKAENEPTIEKKAAAVNQARLTAAEQCVNATIKLAAEAAALMHRKAPELL